MGIHTGGADNGTATRRLVRNCNIGMIRVIKYGFRGSIRCTMSIGHGGNSHAVMGNGIVTHFFSLLFLVLALTLYVPAGKPGVPAGLRVAGVISVKEKSPGLTCTHTLCPDEQYYYYCAITTTS